MNTKQLLKELKMNTKDFSMFLETIPLKLLTHKLSNKGWNILQIIQHINLVEKSILENIQEKYKQNDLSNIANPTLVDYKEILRIMSLRKIKAEAPENFLPQQEDIHWDTEKKTFQNKRQEIHLFYETTHEEKLHQTYLRHGRLGDISLLNWGVIIIGHTKRHKAQIEDILYIHPIKEPS